MSETSHHLREIIMPATRREMVESVTSKHRYQALSYDGEQEGGRFMQLNIIEDMY